MDGGREESGTRRRGGRGRGYSVKRMDGCSTTVLQKGVRKKGTCFV